MSKPGTDRRIDNIEFAVSDIARSREFYGKAFGWTFTDYGLLRIHRWPADGRPCQGQPRNARRTAGDPLRR
jgi:predicted enzyme related to lactoylglutathione lyase